MADSVIVKIPGLWRHRQYGLMVADLEMVDGLIAIAIGPYGFWFGDMAGLRKRFERIDAGGNHGKEG